MILTHRFLIENHACHLGVVAFRKFFPRGLDLTSETDIATVTRHLPNEVWWSRDLLCTTCRSEFWNVEDATISALHPWRVEAARYSGEYWEEAQFQYLYHRILLLARMLNNCLSGSHVVTPALAVRE